MDQLVNNRKDIKVLSISGAARSGKGTAASFIADKFKDDGYNVVEIAFADYLKFALGKYMGLSEPTLTKQNMRSHYQLFGTEFLRSIDDRFHVDIVLKVIEAIYDYNIELGRGKTIFLVPDVRFKNELHGLQNKFNTITLNVKREGGFSTLSEKERQHQSERDLDGMEYDIQIWNNDGLDGLRFQCNRIYAQMKRIYAKNKRL